MKFSFITSTFNAEQDILETANNVLLLKSMMLDSKIDVEWIVVDGKSNDSTLDIINNSNVADKIISEPDFGIYDAWNKALIEVTGDWIVFLGAGDTIDVSNFKNSIPYFESLDTSKIKLVYGKVRLVNPSNQVLKVYADIPNSENWDNGRPPLPCHQGVFHHISIFTQLNYIFDMRYRIAGDSKLLLLVMASFKEAVFLDIEIANMRIGGISTNPKHILRVKRELEMLRRDLNISMPWLAVVKFDCKCYIKHIAFNFIPKSLLQFMLKLVRVFMKKEVLY